MSNMKRGDTVLLLRDRDSVWTVRTPEEKQVIRDGYAEDGLYHDSAGEPFIISPLGAFWRFLPSDKNEASLVTVTSLRPEWVGNGPRPKGLTEGYSEVLKRPVLFIRQ